MHSSIKIKIFHIVTDEKFIKSSTKFNSEMFDNQTFYVGHSTPEHVNTTCFHPSRKNIRAILAVCNANSCIVVFHGLDVIKAYIANRLNRNTLVLWRFFGSELYGKNKTEFYSIKTISVLNAQSQDVQVKLSKLWKKIHLWCKWGFQYKNELQRFRPHYILCTSEEEYSFISEKYNHIPKLIIIPFTPLVQSLPEWDKKEGLIIIGNSRSPYNNHTDIIDIIQSARFRKEFKYILPYNYGNEMRYAKKIKEHFPKELEVLFLENFLPRIEYDSLFKRAKIIVINSYRQHAFGNVVMALYMGVNVYLNTRNPIYHFLKRNNIVVFSIEEFEHHINSGAFPDGANVAAQNYNSFQTLASLQELNQFHFTIVDKFKSLV